MKSLLKTLFIAAALGVTLFGATTSAQADPYWRNHWGWYDNTYRPYYNTYYGPGYGGVYYGSGYSGGYYARPYYGGYNGYYAAPGPYYAPGVGIHVGRANFGWW